MSKEIILSNLDQLTSARLVEGKNSKTKWRKVKYEAGDIKGVMLTAGEQCFPNPVSLKLNVKGWYKIYLCIGRISAENSLQVSLSGEDGITDIMPFNLDCYKGVWRWALYERAEELFFKCADLTDKDLIIHKPKKFMRTPLSANLFYIRLVEMSEKEVEEYKNSGNNKTIQYHMDNDFAYNCDYKNAKEYVGRLNMFEHGNGESLIYECSFDDATKKNLKKELTYSLDSQSASNGYRKYIKNCDAIKAEISKRAHEMGMEIYSGYRLGGGDFAFPYMNAFCNDMEKLLPSCHAKLRNGKEINICSYAYPETRKFMVDKIINSTPEDFDGVSLFFHRIPFVTLFEEPVLEEIKKRYNVDGRRLPITDERYYKVSGEYGTAFVKEVKEALKEKAEREGRKPYKLNVVVLQTVKNNREYGIDVERWARERLVDSISQGHMCYYEKVEDCLDKDGLIDLDKYEEKRKTDRVITRRYDSAISCTIEDFKDFIDLEKETGVDFYAGLPWECHPSETFIATAEKLYELGAKKLIAWNGNHIARKLSSLQATKICGDKKIIESKKGNDYVERKVIKITSLENSDISVVDTNWKG